MIEKRKLDTLLEADIDPSLRADLENRKEALDEAKEIRAALRTPGGRKLTAYLLEDSRMTLVDVMNEYKKEDVSLTRLVSLLGLLESRLSLYNTLKHSEDDVEDIEDGLQKTMDELLG